jgi:hypothetical protein
VTSLPVCDEPSSLFCSPSLKVDRKLLKTAVRHEMSILSADGIIIGL